MWWLYTTGEFTTMAGRRIRSVISVTLRIAIHTHIPWLTSYIEPPRLRISSSLVLPRPNPVKLYGLGWYRQEFWVRMHMSFCQDRLMPMDIMWLLGKSTLSNVMKERVRSSVLVSTLCLFHFENEDSGNEKVLRDAFRTSPKFFDHVHNPNCRKVDCCRFCLLQHPNRLLLCWLW